ncbi:hypothetical protein NKR23_g4012 [Pleurostoma richardsiae]|uniref:Uncharacterized protein n=1 Tax=Pleurostoma richardsiae TaxID=41990 RepID=A0AA38VGC6_9PEZI|nr:hypothetical protein NKR23_g4012 [Pleurostoma richardsiae]
MSGNRVTFRSGDSSPGSGASRSHHGSSRDSGIAQDIDEQRYNVQALQEALAATVNDLDRYKVKARQLDAELITARKELRETEANWRGLFDENEVLKADEKKLRKANREFKDENNNLASELALAHDEIKRLKRELDRAYSPRMYQEQHDAARPEMTPAVPPETSKPHRRNSTRDKSASEKKRLSERFERGSTTEGSESSGSQPKPRKRRDSYVEPWGPGAAGPKVHMPQSPPANRHYEHVATTATRPPVFVNTTDPTFSQVPRTAGLPQIQRPYVETPAPANYYPPSASTSTGASTRYQEPGDYRAYPLPAERPKK